MIRYFCHTDAAGPRADFCARYAEAFVALAYKLRVIPVEIPAPALAKHYPSATAQQLLHHARQAAPPHRWLRLQHLLRTPVNEPYVNVVCSDPFWWARLYTVGVKNVLITGETPASIERIKDAVPVSAAAAAAPRREVVNGQMVEFSLLEMPPTLPDPRDAAVKYAVIMVPSEEVAAAWRALLDEQITVEIDPGDTSAPRDSCQVLVVGLDLAAQAEVLRSALAAA
jgi:hypothetical protein